MNSSYFVLQLLIAETWTENRGGKGKLELQLYSHLKLEQFFIMHRGKCYQEREEWADKHCVR